MDYWNIIKGFHECSLCDWPGKVSAVLFTGGCNLNCPTCHNSTLAFEDETLSPIDKDYIFDKLNNNWLDGIVISGGEPTIHKQLWRVLHDLKDEFGLPIKLDTNGMNLGAIYNLIVEEYVDTVAVDIKGPWDKYPVLIGLPDYKKELIRIRIKSLLSMAKHKPNKYYFRTTKVPYLTEEDLKEVEAIVPDVCTHIFQDYVDKSLVH